MLSKQDAGIIIDELRQEKGLSWSELAERAACPNVWLVSAVLGGDRVHITIDGKYLPYDWVQSDKQ